MRIWIVNQYASTPQHSFGTRHYSLARQLSLRGHDVTIVASSFCHASRKQTRLSGKTTSKKETLDGVEYLWLKTPGYSRNGISRLFDMLVFCFRLLRGTAFRNEPSPDVIIGSSPHLFGAFGAQRLAASKGCPFVLEIRDIWPLTLIELGNMSSWHPLVFLFGAIEKFLYRRADRIITLLPGAGSHVAERIGRQRDTTWISNGVDLGMIPSPPDAPNGDKFTVMYAGSHGIANGLSSIVQAAKIVQDSDAGDTIQFRFVGSGGQKQQLISLATELELTNCSFEEAVQKSEVYDTLSEADAFVATLVRSPLYRHGISLNKLFDYMSVGRPIVFGVEAYNNPVEEAEAGISVEPENPQQIADAILKLVSLSVEERAEMGARGRRIIETQYNVERNGALLEAVLLSACGISESQESEQIAA